MGNVNKVFLMGNLTRDPELRYTPSGTPICEFGIAVNRSYQTREGEQRDESCFVDVSMWGKRGVAISEYFKKGSQIFIEGRLQLDTWETAEGRRSKLRVVAENFEFVGPSGGQRQKSQGGAQPPEKGHKPAPPATKDGGDAAPPDNAAENGYDVSDDEIPF
jgi:single-strand DNA-binding protein